MAKFEWDFDLDDESEPCPMGCGGLTDDPYGGPCERCWASAPKSSATGDELDEWR